MNADQIIGRLRDGSDKLSRWPRKQKQQFVCLEYIINKIPNSIRYTEKEINSEIKKWISFADHVRVRRQLIDFGFLGRTRDGSQYWRL
ncbi:MAG: DUF2087 domain-containing protein [Pseudobacteriovorax sp.]|nr:DUF2087 domain-containing protein [Pseudobacteriovorax sp.]